MPLAEPLIESDIVIIVMGQTGSAKSTFINTLFGKEVVPVGQSLEPCTKKVTGKFLTDVKNLGADRLFVMDTPGLDYEDDKENIEIINQISTLLETDDAAATRQAGIIYLHNIDSIRPAKPDDKQQELFRRSTDHNGWPFLVFGITIWDASPYKKGEIKSKEEAFKKTIWKDMFQAGADIVQVQNGQSTSAWNAVGRIRKAIKHREHFEERRQDVTTVIMLIGQTGSGKSTFISVAGGDKLERGPRIGYDLEPCTKRVEQFLLEDPRNPGQYVRLIDTPGFNSGVTGDQMQLKLIREWLKKEPDTKLTGILFLDGEAKQRPFTPFVTTPRDIPRNPPGIWVITTEENRRDESSYSGAYVKPFDESHASAWKIIGDVQQATGPTITFGKLSKALDPNTKPTAVGLMDRILELLGIKKQRH